MWKLSQLLVLGLRLEFDKNKLKHEDELKNLRLPQKWRKCCEGNDEEGYDDDDDDYDDVDKDDDDNDVDDDDNGEDDDDVVWWWW